MQQIPQFKKKKKISVILFTFSYYTVNVRSIFKNIFCAAIQQEKNHTHMKKVGHLRISIWHLSMNLKNKYLLKKLLKWANKKQNNLNIYKAALKEKRKTPEDIIIKISIITTVPKI